ncbi:TonB-dependent receptor [Frateuria aurantia]|uniref:TonB-dependent siderophore receptor n=1 Tax=Frateuria aurantia (strain ATCC 33424 / DSM 6220 / KCTC 2777 / LMG 1558 / NBRC 3245 / NCIMB 13370) TaxID=767434 RepID=H8L6U8_FRAAD|nr:TonB-dependent siderophore receptor [Frateuria aurantia]AFC86034.1 TonB-dependent siderophore receptor [Frateuria aurantia DSM 6220]
MNTSERASPARRTAASQPARWPLVIAMLSVSGQAWSNEQTTTAPATTPAHHAATSRPKTLEAVKVEGDTGYGDISRRSNLGVLGNLDNMETPFSVISYSSDYIANQQAHTIGDIVANDPSVRVTNGYGNFSELFVIRGFPLNGDDISFDGLYGIIPRQMVVADAIGQLDLLRGASAFLYGVSPGGSGLGGSINIEPKWAGHAPLTRASFDFGTSAQFGGSVDLSRRFGRDQRWGVRVNAGTRGGDTAIDREHGHSSFESISVDYRGNRFRIKANISHQLQRIDEGRNVVYLAGTGVPRAPKAKYNYGQPWSYSSMEDTYGMIRAEYDILSNLTAYVAGGADHSNENGEYASPRVNAQGVGTASRMGVPYNNDSQTGEVGINGLFQTGPVSQRFNASASILNQKKTASYTFSGSYAIDLNHYAAVDYPASTLDAGDPVVTGRTKLHSVALSDTLGFFHDQVLLTLGIRHQSMEVLGYAYKTGARTAHYQQNANSPVAGLLYKISPHVSIYANSIQGLSQGPQAPVGTLNVGAVFPPYKSKQIEAGLKYDHDSFGSTLSVFQIKEPSGLTNPDTLLYSLNGLQRNRGVEWSAFGEPVKGLKVIGGATYTDARLSRTAGGTYDGHIAIGVPRWQYNLGANWAIPATDGLSLGVDLIRTGGEYADQANTLSIPAWTRVDVHASYATRFAGKATTFRMAVMNIGSNDYWASAFGGYLTQGAPREVRLSATMDF